MYPELTDQEKADENTYRVQLKAKWGFCPDESLSKKRLDEERLYATLIKEKWSRPKEIIDARILIKKEKDKKRFDRSQEEWIKLQKHHGEIP